MVPKSKSVVAIHGKFLKQEGVVERCWYSINNAVKVVLVLLILSTRNTRRAAEKRLTNHHRKKNPRFPTVVAVPGASIWSDFTSTGKLKFRHVIKMNKIAVIAQYTQILKEFPGNMKLCFAYGSGVMKQKVGDLSKNMLDLVFVVSNPAQWHKENIERNRGHYAWMMQKLGHKVVARVQEKWDAKIYYNTLVKTKEGRLIKYGVISEVSLIEDLLDWNVLYLAGRLHKPVQVLEKPPEESALQRALLQNLHSAVHAALIMLPEHFSESDFYRAIASLSYNGDFRMIFGEDKNKVNNIVIPQLQRFRSLYRPVLKHFDRYIEIPKADEAAVMCHQDTSPFARIHHLNHLPRMPQVKLVRSWSQGPRSRDTEDCLRAIAHDPECSEILEQCLRDIVWRSSVSQSLKGIITVGIAKSLKYSGAKITKMMQSQKQDVTVLPQSRSHTSETKATVEPLFQKAVKTQDGKDTSKGIE